MAKTRLNQNLRDVLYQKVRQEVTLPELAATEDRAYVKAAAYVRGLVISMYPEKDMEVLRRYDMVYLMHSFRLQLSSGGFEQFSFKDGAAIAVPARNATRAYIAGPNTTDVVQDWVLARDKHKEALGKLHYDYRELIRGSRYLEDVMAVWPEVVALKEAARSTSLIVLSDEVIERIRADVERRKRNAS